MAPNPGWQRCDVSDEEKGLGGTSHDEELFEEHGVQR